MMPFTLPQYTVCLKSSGLVVSRLRSSVSSDFYLVYFLTVRKIVRYYSTVVVVVVLRSTPYEFSLKLFYSGKSQLDNCKIMRLETPKVDPNGLKTTENEGILYLENIAGPSK